VALTAGPGSLLVIADFDGTLAAGSRDPAAARIEPSARRALRRLAAVGAARPGRVHVAILTGRTVADVASRARVGGIGYLGDHGLQTGVLARRDRAERIAVWTDPAFDAQRAVAEHLAVGVADALGTPPWLFVERKGPSVAFHVRQADDVPAARAAVLEAIAAVERRDGLGEHGLVPYRGRSVVDLRPADAGGKREATEGLIARHAPRAVVSFGDDLSDADAFDAVLDARAAGRIETGLSVAVHGRLSAPPDVLSRADLVVGSSADVGRLLAGLARRLERETSG
jgi:trehalose-phosphatase